MPYNPIGVTEAMATPEQVALSGRGVNTAVATDTAQFADRQKAQLLAALEAQRRAEMERRANAARADLGGIVGALAGGGLGAMTGFGGLKGAQLASGMGQAIGGRGQMGSSLIPGALSLARGVTEADKLRSYSSNGVA